MTRAAALGLDATAVAEEAEIAADRIKPFRDDYVVHRSAKNLRASRGLQIPRSGGPARLSIGLSYPAEGEDPPLLTSDDPNELMAALDHYLAAVLDLLEQIAPPE